MPTIPRFPGPMWAFALVFLPAAALAGALAALLSGVAPGLASAAAILVGLAGFVLGVGAAAAGRFGTGPAPVRHVLAMRRCRLVLACRFALIGTAAALALSGFATAIAVPILPGLGLAAGLLCLALLFVAAWLVIGEVACTSRAIHRALQGERGTA